MKVEIKSEATVKHLRNLLVLSRDAKFSEKTGMEMVLFGDAFKYLLEVSNIIEEELKGQSEDK
jgi:hypothetical protein